MGRIRDYVKYSLRELEHYTKATESCVKLINSVTHLEFPPYGQKKFSETLLQIIAKKKIGFFDHELKGIILDIRNIKILGHEGAIRFDSPGIHINMRADFYLFQPQIGAVVKGIVKHISPRQLGVIIYRVFSVTIRLQDEIKHDIEINSEIKFQIKNFDLESVIPFIQGELITPEVKVQINIKDEEVSSASEDEVNVHIPERPQGDISPKSESSYEDISELKTSGSFLTSTQISQIDNNNFQIDNLPSASSIKSATISAKMEIDVESSSDESVDSVECTYVKQETNLDEDLSSTVRFSAMESNFSRSESPNIFENSSEGNVTDTEELNSQRGHHKRKEKISPSQKGAKKKQNKNGSGNDIKSQELVVKVASGTNKRQNLKNDKTLNTSLNSKQSILNTQDEAQSQEVIEVANGTADKNDLFTAPREIETRPENKSVNKTLKSKSPKRRKNINIVEQVHSYNKSDESQDETQIFLQEELNETSEKAFGTEEDQNISENVNSSSDKTEIFSPEIIKIESETETESNKKRAKANKKLKKTAHDLSQALDLLDNSEAEKELSSPVVFPEEGRTKKSKKHKKAKDFNESLLDMLDSVKEEKEIDQTTKEFGTLNKLEIAGPNNEVTELKPESDLNLSILNVLNAIKEEELVKKVVSGTNNSKKSVRISSAERKSVGKMDSSNDKSEVFSPEIIEIDSETRSGGKKKRSKTNRKSKGSNYLNESLCFLDNVQPEQQFSDPTVLREDEFQLPTPAESRTKSKKKKAKDFNESLLDMLDSVKEEKEVNQVTYDPSILNEPHREITKIKPELDIKVSTLNIPNAIEEEELVVKDVGKINRSKNCDRTSGAEEKQNNFGGVNSTTDKAEVFSPKLIEIESETENGSKKKKYKMNKKSKGIRDLNESFNLEDNVKTEAQLPDPVAISEETFHLATSAESGIKKLKKNRKTKDFEESLLDILNCVKKEEGINQATEGQRMLNESESPGRHNQITKVKSELDLNESILNVLNGIKKEELVVEDTTLINKSRNSVGGSGAKEKQSVSRNMNSSSDKADFFPPETIKIESETESGSKKKRYKVNKRLNGADDLSDSFILLGNVKVEEQLSDPVFFPEETHRLPTPAETRTKKSKRNRKDKDFKESLLDMLDSVKEEKDVNQATQESIMLNESDTPERDNQITKVKSELNLNESILNVLNAIKEEELVVKDVNLNNKSKDSVEEKQNMFRNVNSSSDKAESLSPEIIKIESETESGSKKKRSKVINKSKSNQDLSESLNFLDKVKVENKLSNSTFLQDETAQLLFSAENPAKMKKNKKVKDINESLLDMLESVKDEKEVNQQATLEVGILNEPEISEADKKLIKDETKVKLESDLNVSMLDFLNTIKKEGDTFRKEESLLKEHQLCVSAAETDTESKKSKRKKSFPKSSNLTVSPDIENENFINAEMNFGEPNSEIKKTLSDSLAEYKSSTNYNISNDESKKPKQKTLSLSKKLSSQRTESAKSETPQLSKKREKNNFNESLESLLCTIKKEKLNGEIIDLISCDESTVSKKKKPSKSNYSLENQVATTTLDIMSDASEGSKRKKRKKPESSSIEEVEKNKSGKNNNSEEDEYSSETTNKKKRKSSGENLNNSLADILSQIKNEKISSSSKQSQSKRSSSSFLDETVRQSGDISMPDTSLFSTPGLSSTRMSVN